jgi:hypothetical protein
VTVNDIDLRFAKGERTRLAATVSWVQVDNMLPTLANNSNPVVLAPTAVKTPQPTLQVSILAEPNDDPLYGSGKLLKLNLANVVALLQELDCNLEERWLVALWDFWSDLQARRKRQTANTATSSTATSNTATTTSSLSSSATTAQQQQRHNQNHHSKSGPEVGGGGRGLGDLGASLGMGLQETQKIYIRNLELLPTRLNLTFVKAEHNKDTLLGRYQSKESGSEPLGPQQAADERGLGGGVGGGAAAVAGGGGGSGGDHGHSPALFAALIAPILEILVGATGSISKAPLQLKGYQVPHVYGTQEDIAKVGCCQRFSSSLFR